MLNSVKDLWRSIQDMDRNAPMAWPIWLRQWAYALVCAAFFGLLWGLWLSSVHQALTHAEVTQERLKTEFSAKLRRVAPLSDLQEQRSMLEQRLLELEKQLPDEHGMAILLADMSRAGRARHLRVAATGRIETSRDLRATGHQFARGRPISRSGGVYRRHGRVSVVGLHSELHDAASTRRCAGDGCRGSDSGSARRGANPSFRKGAT